MPLVIKRNVLVILWLLLAAARPAGFNSFAAEPITTSQWQKLTDDRAFDYKNDVEAFKPPPKEEEDAHALLKFMQAIYNFIIAARFFIWGIVIAAVVYVIYRVFVNNGSFMFRKEQKKMGNEASLPDEEDMTNTNWEALLQQAVNNKDLRLAVRYRYMWLLQILQRNELIQYRNDKTNYEYYTELNETNYKQPFKQLSRQYEYAWYGNFSLSPAAYTEYGELFNNLRKQLGA